MLRLTLALLFLGCFSLPSLAAAPADQPANPHAHYLFVWAGAADGQQTDFLAVIDASPTSPHYGELLTTLNTDQQTKLVHHTEYVMPVGGILFANDHNAGRTFLFDLRDPLHPRIAGSFTDVDGYMHPHSYLRLPNQNVLATFQHGHDGGGLVELDQQGKLIRSASAADPAHPGVFYCPYSVVLLPEIDRALSTNSAMSEFEPSGTTYQIWRLSDLELLKTAFFEPSPELTGHTDPEEPRRAPDGSVFVQTFSCGLEHVTGIATDNPKASLVYRFPGGACGVPTIVGNYLIEGNPSIHGIIALDISNPDKPVEVSRISFPGNYLAHWTGWDAATSRIVVTPGPYSTHRLYLVRLDQATGKLTIDDTFRDKDGQPGFNFDNRTWPQGWTGSATPHGAVFSR
ncbi:MAG TPA: hypothetical protein VE218_13160 [Acidobacteriaceae bacterium]|nr:hypothetical protein [Acidobacteriaceae bacterium]